MLYIHYQTGQFGRRGRVHVPDTKEPPEGPAERLGRAGVVQPVEPSSQLRVPLAGGQSRGGRGAILVYVLEDPRDGRPRYVAIVWSGTLPSRYSRHAEGHFRGTTGPWCDELRGAGLAPRVRVLERVECASGRPEPEDWSAAGRRLGAQLARLRGEGADLIRGTRRGGWRALRGAGRRRP